MSHIPFLNLLTHSYMQKNMQCLSTNFLIY
uniref:Uncharacterized protein n=1 Tax=Anguilla anguilla TaxID=7936 RepID=A0A0E9VWF5_ANGAN